MKADTINIHGELADRLKLNFDRLEGTEYRPESVFSMDKNGWPADWEGRTILALVLLESATGRKPVYLDAILKRLEGELNEKGYLKGICEAGTADEQQLSGHNWLVRGLIAHYRLSGNEKSLNIIKTIIKNLYMPTESLYSVYPTDPALRGDNGTADGHIAGFVNGWRLSTDIGCAFMCMDALSEYYELTHDKNVERLLMAMFAALKKIDFVAANMQTHASLTACRGIMRLYSVTGNKELLDFVVEFFELYKKKGMTDNYANFNWFGRPLWTEPCAIVDSFMLSLQLWQTTHKTDYIRFANKAFYNALYHAQRENGGFGCDECTRPENPFIRASVQIYEAYWCCSMRGAEGLYTAAAEGVIQKEGAYYITGFASGEYRFGEDKVSVECRLPQSGYIKVISDKETFVYVPEGITAGTLTVNGVHAVSENGFVRCGKGENTVVFGIGIMEKPTVTEAEGLKTYWKGDLLMGEENGVMSVLPCGVNYSKKVHTEKNVRVIFDMSHKPLSHFEQ